MSSPLPVQTGPEHTVADPVVAAVLADLTRRCGGVPWWCTGPCEDDLPAAAGLVDLPVRGPAGGLLVRLRGGPFPVPPAADVVASLPAVLDVRGAVLGRDEDLRQEAARRREAERVAGTDPLTGLLNRRGWDLALAGATAASDPGRPAVVVVLDLDDLKTVNDVGGHDAGDALLRRAGRLVAGAVEACDAVARTGGDEFCVLLLGRDTATAAEVVHRLGDVLTAAGVPASVGAAAADGPDLAGAWARADEEMYEDKRVRKIRRNAVPAAPTPAGDDAWSGVEVDDLLRLLTDQLGTDAAFVSRFTGEDRYFRNIVADFDTPVEPGDMTALEGTYCRLIVDGVVPGVIPDALEVPVLADLPLTRALSIRRYLGAPVRTRDGRLYGTVCTFSRRPASGRDGAADARVLQALADVVARRVEEEDGRTGRR
ncbi:diguanylate cyclase [Kineococcus endophyticus]|uniref:Diguanylate cyclase n=1 Tax=Kineococcus endophyticus TaxID=1181883 RepID=A0ABV3PCB7_9ACTN